MSATLPILSAITEHLTQALPDWQIELLPENPSEYYLAHPNGAVLVGYLGSQFGKLRASDIVSQSRSVQLAITLISRNLHDDTGALELLDKLRLLLVGFKPPNCAECFLLSEQFDGEENGIWQYQLILQTETVQIQKVPEKELPKLVEVIKRRTGQALDPQLTKKLTPKLTHKEED
ncbi:hypothetical protein FHQ28_08745 [Pasteurellaceae bacterium USgator11]|nr:hypothetical protein FHQ20_10185 [Pasteurellaceae bacterium USgator41]TNG98708.1 hypothetical protein FHQ24_07955 [Pasteurellaceae bacterium UScroc31]TNH00075.1 hypothetical protein FHQ28_08745 [Pasteurellaceae bacterium USgator11]